MSSNKNIRVTWFIPEQIKTKIRRLLGLSAINPNLVLPSVWIRGLQVASYLEKLNFEISFNTLDPHPDISIFLRRYDADDFKLMQRLKQAGTKIIVDVVANYFQTRESSPEGYGGASRRLVHNFVKLLEVADQVWTVSPYLREQAVQVNSESYFVSDSVDPVHFDSGRFSKSQASGPMVLGWSGAAEKASELNALSPILVDLIKLNQIRVLVVTRRRPELRFDFEFRHWDHDTFPEMISQCDICIAPRRVKNEYDLGHSLFKIGVFMSMGVPAIAGPVPSYSLLLEDGQAGAICHSIDDWYMHMHHFIEDDTARLSAGGMAREKMKPYLTPLIAAQVTGLLQKILGN
ncbi:MAG: hypothetical protein A2Z16_14965 [Chloroflexi bacterium RBG_16_54_18]|nr:MAG: hypothetical protein A2Z16_14965 [Chloroflexi bacterium RBG_16_54_18]